MSAIDAVMVTGTPGPSITHIPLDSEAGLTKYPLSWANAATVQAIPKARFRRRRGRLSADELAALETALRTVLAS